MQRAGMTMLLKYPAERRGNRRRGVQALIALGETAVVLAAISVRVSTLTGGGGGRCPQMQLDVLRD